MNSELINEIKAKYKMHLSTEEGQKQLMNAVRIKKMWREERDVCDIIVSTTGVNPRLINKELNKKITKMEIVPIGLNNMCHLTSELLRDDARGITRRIGYNITACPCGRLMSYELHSVNKCGEQLYDFTRDFNDEKHKYFLEMDTDMPALTYISIFNKEPLIVNKGCRCPVNWSNPKECERSEADLIKHIQMVKKIQVY